MADYVEDQRLAIRLARNLRGAMVSAVMRAREAGRDTSAELAAALAEERGRRPELRGDLFEAAIAKAQRRADWRTLLATHPDRG